MFNEQNAEHIFKVAIWKRTKAACILLSAKLYSSTKRNVKDLVQSQFVFMNCLSTFLTSD